MYYRNRRANIAMNIILFSNVPTELFKWYSILWFDSTMWVVVSLKVYIKEFFPCILQIIIWFSYWYTLVWVLSINFGLAQCGLSLVRHIIKYVNYFELYYFIRIYVPAILLLLMIEWHSLGGCCTPYELLAFYICDFNLCCDCVSLLRNCVLCGPSTLIRRTRLCVR